MRGQFDIEQLLRWRLERAESEATSPPSGLELLRRARPWWELAPERFAASVRRLGAIQVSYGYAMSELQHGRGGHPVPTLISHNDDEDVESPARVLYVSIHDGRLRLRFHLDPVPRIERGYEVTFVSEAQQPLLSAYASLSVDGEYRLDVELPEELATTWQALKVTDRMPFRFILRPEVNAGGL